MQAQINPHFLYNTLNSVVRMVGMSRNEEVITMITSLSRLFRISLSQGKTIITIREEPGACAALFDDSADEVQAQIQLYD